MKIARQGLKLQAEVSGLRADVAGRLDAIGVRLVSVHKRAYFDCVYKHLSLAGGTFEGHGQDVGRCYR